MASQLDIANWALMLLGQGRISSLSDDSPKAENIAAGWDMVRDSAIDKQAWHCHIERASLPADSAAPLWGFDYQFTLASNVIRVLQVGEFYPGPDLSSNRNSDTALFRIEGRKILTSLGAPLYVKCLVNSKDVGEWSASFARFMAADLADFLQPRTTQSDAIAARITQWRFDALVSAAASNAIEDPSDPVADDTWMAAHSA